MERLSGALGLCAKAGKLIYGTPMVCEALAKPNAVKIVLMPSDNSENTQKRLRDKCEYYGVRLAKIPIDGETLAHAVGKSGKIAAVGVTDENLYRMVWGIMEQEHII